MWIHRREECASGPLADAPDEFEHALLDGLNVRQVDAVRRVRCDDEALVLRCGGLEEEARGSSAGRSRRRTAASASALPKAVGAESSMTPLTAGRILGAALRTPVAPIEAPT